MDAHRERISLRKPHLCVRSGSDFWKAGEMRLGNDVHSRKMKNGTETNCTRLGQL